MRNMKEQISLTYAKQNFKRNQFKYGVESAFENAILTYNLQNEEITKLYEYVIKNANVNNIYGLENIMSQYKGGE